ncbi:hypothetical protein [Paenarthrobacter aurescens]|uniref:hypothetical protein n=1 Tax=Paenarthrobacter aurescens TaxID=43663 RepID=UPI0021C07D06|nr:hypothetical protein [Paenarthrobacter aurescens]MCT9868425.1 hypothetical protein [Paenarthrobacter aurescens]
MNLPLFHDPLQGAVTVDAPVRDPQIGRDAAFRHDPQPRTAPRKAGPAGHGSKPSRSARQREVAKVADDLRALMARTAAKH